MTTASNTRMAGRSWAQMVKGDSDKAPVAPAAAKIIKDESEEAPAVVAPAVAKEPLMDWLLRTSTDVDSTVADEDEDAPEISADVVEDALEHPAVPPGIFTAALVESKPAKAQPLKPGQRGSLACFCYGRVLHMLSHYGWLETFAEIDHPLANLHMGRIYLQKSDIMKTETEELASGDLISFYLYVDKNGLGAEGCHRTPEGENTTVTATVAQPTEAKSTAMRPDAAAFVPGGVADVFTRMSRTFESIPANGYVQMAGFTQFNFDDFTDSESEDDAASVDADKESLRDESDGSSVEELPAVQKAKQNPLAQRAWGAWGKQRSASPDRSTCAGMTSDSSMGITSESENEKSCWKKVHGVPQDPRWPPFRPPPGLSLPVGV